MRQLSRVCLILLALSVPALSAPRISEFVAENTKTFADEDGDFPDWIEIFNPDATAVNLTGYSLTDDALVPNKWVFPSVTLQSGGFLVVFASGKNRLNPAGELHTNFALETNGEYLALVAPGGAKLTEFTPTFPPQEKDRSYGSFAPLATTTPIPTGAACKWIIPSAAIANWNARTFVDTAWSSGVTGVGYERTPGNPVNYTALIGAGSNVQSAMYNIRGTCYIRVPFNVPNAAAVSSIALRMKCDDGFIAYLNGTVVAFRNPPTTTPAWNSLASDNTLDDDAVVFENFDITQYRSALVNGTNMLAIHGLNGTLNSSDFIILPEVDIATFDNSATLTTGYFATPTAGSINSTAPVAGFVKDTHFSVDHGFFTAPFTVALTCNTPGAQLRYTTNGSAPTATTGTVYSTPVAISTTTVLRVAGFVPGWQSSNTDTQTYIFAATVRNQSATQTGFPTNWGHAYDFNTGTLTGPLITADYAMDTAITNNAAYSSLVVPALETTLPVLAITGDTTAIFGSTSGIYSDGRLNETEVPAAMEFFGPGAGEGFRVNCGLRIHGGDALVEHPKKPFRMYFRKEYGTGKLDYPIFPESPVRKFNRLQLRPGGHDGWSVPFGNTANDLAYHATYSRDEFLRHTEIAQGRLAPHGRFVHLYINGLYWGFYNLHEVPADDYFKSHFGGEEEDWDVLEQNGFSTGAGPFFKEVDGNGDALNVLLALCTPPTRPADPLIYDQIRRYLDVDEFIDHMIVQIWAAQNDWMGPVFLGASNYSRFFNKNWDTGRLSRGPSQSSFYFNVWDAEISMGSQLAAVASQRIVNFDHSRVGEPGWTALGSTTVQTPGPPAIIYNALRSNADFRTRFADRLQKHFFNGGALTVANNQARLTEIRNTLNLPIVPESARWGDVNATSFGGTPDFARDSHWIPEMNWLASTFIAQRNSIVLGQFQARGLSSSVIAPTFAPFGGLLPPTGTITMGNPNAGGAIYYTTDGTDPYASGGPIQTKLITESSPSKYWIPADASLGTTWKDPALPANIATWSDGTSALGYDLATTYFEHFSTDVFAMYDVNATIYVRIPFTIASQTQLDSVAAITLRLKAEDGCVTYLNGSLVNNINGPATQTYNSPANAAILESEAQVFQGYDWTAQKPNLVVGTNWLCLQGLNADPLSSDFLLTAELVITTGSTSAGVSPTAQIYSAPVPLAQTGTVKARILNAGTWSALTEADYIVGVPANATNFVLSEFNYQPAPPSAAEITAGYTSGADFEYLELYNPTTSTLELTGLKFTIGITYDFANSSIQNLGPGGRILIVRDPAAFAARYGAGLPVAGAFAAGSGLSNAGERIQLLDASDAAIFDFTYEDSEPWPNPPADSGVSLVLLNPESFPNHALPGNWRLSAFPGGSPAADDREFFDTWLAANGGTGGMLSDPDEDDIVNLLEYALAGSPSQNDTSILPTVALQALTPGGAPGTYLTISFRRNAAAEDIACHVEFGTSPDVFVENGVHMSSTHHLDGTITEKWRSSTPVAAAIAQFARVRVLK